MINPRKLAAIDVAFLGSKLIITEFAVGVILSLALGGFILLRAGSFWQFVLALYFISLGFNCEHRLSFRPDHKAAVA